MDLPAAKRRKRSLKVKKPVSAEKDEDQPQQRGSVQVGDKPAELPTKSTIDLTRNSQSQSEEGVSDNGAGVGDISERLVALRQTLTELLPGFLGMRASAWRELPPITLEQNQEETNIGGPLSSHGYKSWSPLPPVCKPCSRRTPCRHDLPTEPTQQPAAEPQPVHHDADVHPKKNPSLDIGHNSKRSTLEIGHSSKTSSAEFSHSSKTLSAECRHSSKTSSSEFGHSSKTSSSEFGHSSKTSSSEFGHSSKQFSSEFGNSSKKLISELGHSSKASSSEIGHSSKKSTVEISRGRNLDSETGLGRKKGVEQRVPEAVSFHSVPGVGGTSSDSTTEGSAPSKLQIPQSSKPLFKHIIPKAPTHEVTSLPGESKDVPLEKQSVQIKRTARETDDEGDQESVENVRRESPLLSSCPLCQTHFEGSLSQVDVDGHIAACYAAAEDDNLPGETSPLPSCPLCQMRFDTSLSQMDIDAHIAACFSAADDDVTW